MMDKAAGDDPRVSLAVQRTFLAWTRTALALMGFGFVVARIGLVPAEFASGTVDPLPSDASSASLWLGVILVVMGVGVQAMALVEYLQFERRYIAGTAAVPARAHHVPVLGFGLIAIGLGMAGYLISTL